MNNRAPEPTEVEIERASKATAKEVFDGSDGKLTVAYYRRLCALGIDGVIAMNLFRASKTSARAKQYRGRYRGASYDVKNYSLSNLCESLSKSSLSWGWKRDPNTPGYEWVLYIDLPNGQVSYHSSTRGSGPDYKFDWDGVRESTARVLAYCDHLLAGSPLAITKTDVNTSPWGIA